MNWQLSLAPLLPVPVIIAAIILGCVLIGLCLWSRTGAPLWRLLLLAGLSFALFNPQINNEQRQPLSDIAVLVLDRSQSQLVDHRNQRTNTAETELRDKISQLDNTELRSITVTSGIGASEDGTRAITALKKALADVPPERFAGALIVTDGQIHDVPKDGKGLNFDGPIHGLITARKNEVDRRITIINAPRFAIVGEAQPVSFKVEQSGPVPNQRLVDVTIKLGGKVVGVVQTLIGEVTKFPLAIEHGGPNIAELSVPVIPDELTTSNNHAVIVTQGVRDRLRVLLVSGKPHPGERTWRNLLKADASVDLVHFTILRPPEKQDGTPIHELSLIAFPTRELFVDKLDDFDLIIFDRYQRRGVLPMAYMANIAAYVSNGGAVLVAAGPDYATPLSIYRTPLADVLSAVPTGGVEVKPFRPRLTENGQRHPVTHGLGGGSKTPEWGHWFRLIDSQPRQGITIMQGLDDKPLLQLSRREKGRVAELMSDHAWLWARGFDGGGPYAELLRRLAHWLMKEPELEEEALKGHQVNKQLIVERQTMADKASPVTVTLPSGKSVNVEMKQASPGLWRGQLPVSEAGIYTLQDDDLTSVAAIGSTDPRETAELHGTDKKLQPLITATHAGLAWIAPSDGGNEVSLPQLIKIKPGRAMAGPGWMGLQANGAYRVTAIKQIPLFGSLLTLALLLALACLMWYRESR